MRLKPALFASVFGLCLVTISHAQAQPSAGTPNTVLSLGGGQFTADSMATTDYLCIIWLLRPETRRNRSFSRSSVSANGTTNVTAGRSRQAAYGSYLWRQLDG